MIIGQEKTTSEMKRVMEIFQASEGEIRPHFILTGPSGAGKTHIIQTLCDALKMGFLEINAAQITKEGTSGNSISKALSPLINQGKKLTVCFVDEFDKLFVSGNSNDSSAHESTTGVQNEFLKILESPVTSVYGDYGKYVTVPVSKVLFIFAGAFNNEPNIGIERLREIGVKTEFLGRAGLVYNLEALTLENLFQILDNSELFHKYCLLFKGVDKEKALYDIKAHIARNFEFNTLGARYINTLVNRYFICNGDLSEEEVAKVSFNKALTFTTTP